MKLLLAAGLAALVVAATGCTSYPRYRTGAVQTLPSAPQIKARLSTEDYLRFGTIVQEYLGKPYHGASFFLPGVDCSMFTREVFKRFNETDLPRTVKGQFERGHEVSVRQLSVGDLVFFKTEGAKVSHVGIYLGEQRFAHASSSQGVIISGLQEKYWSERFAGARRVLE
ncbi:MAG TPA: C40 family peptidase [Candidatus Deferrimicrobium sp.]|nr:C40 family peptidase [Candidatus Deferrimicrobium sp.]